MKSINHLKECKNVEKRPYIEKGKAVSWFYCPTHDVQVCGCGLSFKDHRDHLKASEETMRHAKSNCIMCERELAPTLSRFVKFGNLCERCTAKCNHAAQFRRKFNLYEENND